jgi:hypothetical protein
VWIVPEKTRSEMTTEHRWNMGSGLEPSTEGAVSRTAFPCGRPCPCDSGRTYDACCQTKGIRYLLDEASGEVYKEIELPPDARAEFEQVVEAQREKFKANFGREPGPDDKLFFDVDEQQLRQQAVAAMKKAGIRPALIYAYEKTGLLVTEANQHLIADKDLAEYNEAIAQYEDVHPDKSSDRLH